MVAMAKHTANTSSPLSSIRKYLVDPPAATAGAGFVYDNFAVIELRRRRNDFFPATSAVTGLPSGLLTPSFDSQNIQDLDELAEVAKQTVEAAGMISKRRWSVALPEGVARTLIVTLEAKPSGRRELAEILSWKIERAIAAPASGLRISKQRISPLGGQERYLLTVATDEVILEYEAFFARLRWKAGIVLPRHLGEAQWLGWDDSPGDKMLISANQTGFSSIILRDGEPLLVRAHDCEPDAVADELYRVALYYRDRIAGRDIGTTDLSRLLIIGEIDRTQARRSISEAIGSEPALIDPAEFGMEMRGEPIAFDHLAAAGGLATLAWQ